MTDRDYIGETRRHIKTVQRIMTSVVLDLIMRSNSHDESKLHNPEFDIFKRYTPALRGMTYGSKEYKACLDLMSPALESHYEKNSHHPDHFENGIRDMTLLDLIEMLCDWYAATKRHDDGDIDKSISMNSQRFGYSDELKDIFKNTAELFKSRDL